VDHLAFVLEGQGVQHDVPREVAAAIRRLVVALIALKLVALAIDPTIRVYLGDSAAYLFGAMDSGRLPDDRSFTYSLLIRALVRPFESLWALLAWQTLAGILTAIVVWQMLVRRLAVSPRMALAASCALAIEPAQLYYERMVLAESFGLLAFVMFVAAAAAYVSTERVWLLPVAALLGLAASTLRLNYLPVVIVSSLLLPVLPWVERKDGRPRPQHRNRRLLVHGVVGVVSLVVLHGTFQIWVARIFNAPPGYIARTGFMQLALVLPLVTPDHLERVGLPRTFTNDLRFPIEDPDARMSHQWAQGGFVRTLRERGISVEGVARPLARMALADDPFGLLRLGIHTLGNYFRERGIAHALSNDLGRRVIPDEILWTLREIWGYDAAGLWSRTTAVSWYFEKGTWLLVLCLFVLPPLALFNVAAYWRMPQRPQMVLLGLISVGLVAAHILFVPVAFYRYLHPLPAFAIMNVCAAAASRRVTQTTSSTPTHPDTTDRQP
jgi:hypothetical protein